MNNEKAQLLQNRINNKGIEYVYLTEYSLSLYLNDKTKVRFGINYNLKENLVKDLKELSDNLKEKVSDPNHIGDRWEDGAIDTLTAILVILGDKK